MKKIGILLFSLIAFNTYAQPNLSADSLDYVLDTIFLHNQKNIACQVLSIDTYLVSFEYPDDDAVQVLSRYAVNNILFGGKKMQHITDKIDIEGDKGWQNVVILEDKQEAVGLKPVAELIGKNASINFRSIDKADVKATENIKKEAALDGCEFIVITSESINDYRSENRKIGIGSQDVKQGYAFTY
ncbi:MAG: hypothetical protein QM528_05095 [Phycisphaerales bacterium]|nr:hypothetical protein [Phycisphaerales bacterium]